ncbi:IclR family transcriptional regulator [Nocardioides mesophilus]|uniref:IclR family transcriptional regulator n=1 Tax=Nocardioides mesophilus TaxID=433659 RepID=A0A7G9RE22_9ACTN|nr:IclR family transcriptional regulator [Nocardioides mesophilus]QNN53847.1 IclR family transcriptional regulator [Nocardioides mesophilus]
MPPSLPATPEPGVRSLQRAIDVLALFDERHPTRTVRDVVDGTGLPKTTAVRLLATLEGRGLVSRVAETTYSCGPALLRWVRLAEQMWQVSPAARAEMRGLVDRCGETVNVYVRQGLDRVCVAQEEGTATVRSVVPVGVPLPLGRGATAKVLLAGAPPGLLDELAGGDPGLDPAARAALVREVDAVRSGGWAVSHGERELGASAVAAPLAGADGRVLAALSVSGPTSRFTDERVPGYVEAVRAAAQAISRVGLGPVGAFL